MRRATPSFLIIAVRRSVGWYRQARARQHVRSAARHVDVVEPPPQTEPGSQPGPTAPRLPRLELDLLLF